MNKVYNFQPGNGSKYRIGIFEVSGGKAYVITWFRDQNSGPCFYFKAGEEFNLDYICGKMDIEVADATAILSFAQRMTPLVVVDLFHWKAIVELGDEETVSA